MLGLWGVDRSGEGKRFDEHKSITNRKLLWHGTNGEGAAGRRGASAISRRNVQPS